MRTHVFLTPMTPDGKPGEVREMQISTEAPKFLAPVSPWAVNEKQLGDLRTAVTEAETALRHAKSRRAGSAEITRLDKALTSAKRDLSIVEYELRRNRQREQTGGNDVFTRREVRQTLAELVGSVSAAVAAMPPIRKAKNSWDTWCADFDQRLAKHALPAKPQAGPPACCEGQFKCGKCAAA